MSAIADIVVYDGEATPVSHTFKAVHVRMTKDNVQEAFYRESISGIPLEAQPTLRLTSALLPSGIRRLACRIEIPVMESVAGNNAAGYTAAPKVAYTVTAEYVTYTPSRATSMQRRNLRHMVQNLFRNIQTTSGPYTGGPVNELMDEVISPT